MTDLPFPEESSEDPVAPAVAVPSDMEDDADVTAPMEAPAPEPTGAIPLSEDSALIPKAFSDQGIGVGVEETFGFWIGTLPTSPLFNVNLGGIMFSRMTERITGTDLADRIPGAGQRVQITAAQVTRIRRSIACYVFRMRGNGTGFLIRADRPTYQRGPTDKPLAHFVYMQAVAETPGAQFSYPDPLVTSGE